MFKIININGYGCWFPSWLMTTENSLISKIEVHNTYILSGQVDKKDNILNV